MKQPIEDKNAPWRDRGTLERLYVEEGMTQTEIGEQFGVAQKTISRWLERYDLEYPWRDEETMRELYEDEMQTTREIAEQLNCGRRTVLKWLDNHGIEVRSAVEETRRIARQQPPAHKITRSGYEVVETAIDGSTKQARIHRLVVVAERGLGAIDGKIVHHKNGIPWDNRPENLEVMTEQEHGDLHKPVEIRWGNATPRELYQTDG